MAEKMSATGPGRSATLPPRLLVRERTTGLFFRSLGSWTKTPKDAYVFRTPESAVRFCQYHAITNVSVVTRAKTGDYQVIRKVPGPKSRPPAAEAAR